MFIIDTSWHIHSVRCNVSTYLLVVGASNIALYPTFSNFHNDQLIACTALYQKQQKTKLAHPRCLQCYVCSKVSQQFGSDISLKQTHTKSNTLITADIPTPTPTPPPLPDRSVSIDAKGRKRSRAVQAKPAEQTIEGQMWATDCFFNRSEARLRQAVLTALLLQAWQMNVVPSFCLFLLYQSDWEADDIPCHTKSALEL